MVAFVFPFTMELLAVVLFGLVALPVWLATRVLEAAEEVLRGRRGRDVTRLRSGRDRRR